MFKLRKQLRWVTIVLFLSVMAYGNPVIYVNQIGFNPKSPKIAVVGFDGQLQNATFHIVNTAFGKMVFGPKTRGYKNYFPKQSPKAKFKVLVLYENGGHHLAFTKAAKPWLNKLAADSSFTVDYIENTKNINEAFLQQYQVFLQLDYPPYSWNTEAVKAFEKYINSGKGGWIGLHHATLLGEFDGYPIWQWFSDFMGGIRFVNYIPEFANATVNIEDQKHPVTKGLPSSFKISKEEWYIYDKSPRKNVHVLGAVDETTYDPNSTIKMGDHPVIWTNEHFASRNVYIFMGHSPELFENEAYTTLLKNAIFWAANRN